MATSQINAANVYLEQAKLLQGRLAEEHGLDSNKIDELLNKQGLESVLGNMPLLVQFFRTHAHALQALTGWDFDNPTHSRAAQNPGIDDGYEAYFNPESDFGPGESMEEDLIFNPQRLLSEGYLDEEQARSLAYLLKHGMFASETASETMASGEQGQGHAHGMPSSAHGGVGPKALGSTGLPPAPAYPGSSPTGMPGVPGVSGGGSAWMNPQLQDFLNSFQEGAHKDILGGLFQDQSMTNQLYHDIMLEVEGKRTMKDRLQQLYNNLDPTNPEDMAKIRQIQMEMGDVDQSIRELLDKMGQVQQSKNERMQLMDGILKIINDTAKSIINNTRN